MIQALSTKHRWVDIKNEDPRDSSSYQGMFYLTGVRIGDFQDSESIAHQLRMNRFSGWNCQDYVMDLPSGREEEGIIDPNDD